MSTPAAQPLNEAKLHEFVMKAVGEMGAAMNAVLILIGDKLGLYKAMAGAGPVTPRNSRQKPKRPSDTSANGFRPRPQADLSPMMLRLENSLSRLNRRWRLPMSRVPSFFRASSNC